MHPFLSLLAFGLLLVVTVSASPFAKGGCSQALFVPPPYDGQVVLGSTVGAAGENDKCGLSSDSNTGTYFYTVSVTLGSTFNVSTCHPDTTFDTVIAVYSGESCNSLECVTYVDDGGCEAYSSQSSTLSFVANQTSYWIMVSGYGGNEGQFELSFDEVLAGSAAQGCADALTLHGPFIDPVSVVGSISLGATDEPCQIDSSCIGDWYIVYPSQYNNIVTVSTCGNYSFSIDTVIAVLEGNDCDELSCIAVSDDDCPTNSALSSVQFSATSPFYYIYVTGYEANNGTYELTVSESKWTPSPSYTPSRTREAASRTPSPTPSFNPEPASRTPTPTPSFNPSPISWPSVSLEPSRAVTDTPTVSREPFASPRPLGRAGKE